MRNHAPCKGIDECRRCALFQTAGVRSETNEIPRPMKSSGRPDPEKSQLIQSFQAVREFDAIDVLKRTSGVTFTASVLDVPAEFMASRFVGVVHAHDLRAAGDEVAVQPDFTTVVDPRKLEEISRLGSQVR